MYMYDGNSLFGLANYVFIADHHASKYSIYSVHLEVLIFNNCATLYVRVFYFVKSLSKIKINEKRKKFTKYTKCIQ